MGLAFMQKNNLKHGKLSPSRILWNNEGNDRHGRFKISVIESVIENFKQFGDNVLSEPKFFSEDVYALGKILYEATTLKKPLCGNLKERIERWKTRYSKQWLQFVYDCLNPDVYTRRTAKDIVERLQAGKTFTAPGRMLFLPEKAECEETEVK